MMTDERCSYHKRRSCVTSPPCSTSFHFGSAILLISTVYIALIYPPFSTQGTFVHGLSSSSTTYYKISRRYTTHAFMGPTHGGGEDHTPPFETLYEYDSSGGTSMVPLPPRAASELFKRKKLKSKKKKDGKSSQPVTENDIVQHVASKYVTGPGGVLYTSEMKRKKMEDVTTTASQLFEMDPTREGQYSDFLKKLDRHPALVLNANYQPLSILPLSLWPWQETIKSLFSGKVVVVDVYPDIFIKAVNMRVPLPSVIALTDFVAQQPNQKPAFTRRNVYLRDNYRCQYCGQFFRSEHLSLDHVIPRCAGGKLVWDNTVTSCLPCNGRKGSMLPKELRTVGMSLIRQPLIPTKYDLAREASKFLPRKIHPTWKPYVGFTSTLSFHQHGPSLSEHIQHIAEEMETDILSYFADENKGLGRENNSS